MRLCILIVIVLAAAPACLGQPCGTNDVQGAYGFQLSGVNTIAGTPVATAVLGRIVFEGEGRISGYSSVNFRGLFLGNPVTGQYSFGGADCGLSFSLQDDSGAFQHFSGKVNPGGARINVTQTDPGTGGRGTLERTAEACRTADVRGTYAFSYSGAATPFTNPKTPATGPVTGTVEADGNGSLVLTAGDAHTAGTYTVEDGCFVQITMALPAHDGPSAAAVRMRGIAVNGGKRVLAIETNPQQTATAQFTAR